MNRPNQEIDQKNLLSAIVLSVAVLVLWQYFFPPPPPVEQLNQPPAEVVETSPNTPAPPSSAQATPAAQTEQPAAVAPIEPEVVHTLENQEQLIKISSYGGVINGWTLKDEQYSKHDDDGSSSLLELLVPTTAPATESGFRTPIAQLKLNGRQVKPTYTVSEQNQNSVVLSYTDPVTKFTISNHVTLGKAGHLLHHELTFNNLGVQPVAYDLGVGLTGIQDDQNAEGSMFMPPLHQYESLCKRDTDFERLLGGDIIENNEDGDPNKFSDGIRWAGIGTRYFLTGLYSKDGRLKYCDSTLDQSEKGFSKFNLLIGIADGTVAPGTPITVNYSVFIGPKELSKLSDGEVSMEDAIDFGFFHVICKPMLWIMHFFIGFFPNWGVAIILLTVLVKILTLPLTIKQYRSMAAMKTVQPQLKKLQEKYKEDKMRLQQEMMKLYKENKVNPLAGCLPMIMMMPIYFALYRTIYSAVELYQAPFTLWLTDLSKEDPTMVSPILLGVLMLIQMKLNPSAGDQAQMKVMMYVMPIMFTGMMLFLPSGLVVYILVNTLLGIIQQFYMYRKQGVLSGKAKA